MGLISALVGSASSALADSWRDYFNCDSLAMDVLVARGEKRKNGSNKKGSDNVISNGSIIQVDEGQCALVVSQGEVVEVCAEAGKFVYDTSTEPSIFYGGLGKGIVDTFKQIGTRFTFGGDTATDQRVYYFNTKEIMDNKYGTANPIPFRVVDTNIGLDMDISLRCHGEYSYKITNPILFYKNVCGNVENAYMRSQIDDQLDSEFLTALQPAFAKISEMGIRYSAVPGHTAELSQAMNEVLTKEWKDIRGIEIVRVGVRSVTASAEDEAMIKELQKSAVLRDPRMAAATITGAQAEAMKSAAANESTGPMMAFAGMNMAMNAGGMNAGQLFQMNQANNGQTQNYQTASNGGFTSGQSQPQATMQGSGWTCECGQTNTGKFCSNCGKPQPQPVAPSGWVCECGQENSGKFCSNCGKPQPVAGPKCSKCGWEPADPASIPKFCPECGTPFQQ